MAVDNVKEEVASTPQNINMLMFSSTNLGKSLFWTMAEIFCLVYATDTLGINPSTAGIIILMTLIWDALSDPIVGLLVDQNSFLYRRYWLTIAIATPLCAIFLALVFATQFADEFLQPFLFTCALLLFRTAFTFLDIPDNALFSRVAKHKQLRISAALYRKLMATVGSVAIALSTKWVFDHDQGLSEGLKIFYIVVIVGPISAAVMTLGAHSVNRWDNVVPSAKQQPISFPIVKLIKHKALAGLFFHMFFSSLGMSLFISSLIYTDRFILEEDAWFATAMALFLVFQAVGVILCSLYASLDSTVRTLTITAILSLPCVFMFYSTSNASILLLSCSAFGFCAGGMNSLRWVIAPAVVDITEISLSKRYEATTMALFSLSIKSGIGVASLVLGLVLEGVGYIPGITANIEQSDDFRAYMLIAIMCSIVVSIFPIQLKHLMKSGL